MDTIQEIRAEVRELLSNALVRAKGEDSRAEFITYQQGKITAYRSVLALIGEVE
jgi:hypothetical protein